MKRKNFLVVLFLLLSMMVIYGCSNNQASTDSTDTNTKVSENKDEEDEENTKNRSEEENKEDSEEDSDDKKMNSDTVDSKFIVPGYKLGEIPAIEMPVLPDLLITEKPDAKFKIDVTKDLASVPGVTVTPVKIENGSIVSGDIVVQTGKGGSGQISKGNKVF